MSGTVQAPAFTPRPGIPPGALQRAAQGQQGGIPVPQMPMQGGAPGMMPGGPQMPQGAPQPQQMGGPQIVPPVVGGAAVQNPNLALFAQAAQGMGNPTAQGKFTPQEMAQLGRLGDKTIAHLTPGEIQVPPELQTPQVLATLHKAFNKAGVSPAQFTAGSPASSVNPATGAQEYSLWASLLPVLGAVAGAFVGAPYVGAAAGGAIGGGLGGAASGAIDHQNALGILGSAAGGAAGGYLGNAGGLSGLLGSGTGAASGALGSAGADAASSAATSAATKAPFTAGVNSWDGALAASAPTGAAAPANPSASIVPNPTWGQRLQAGLYAGGGATLGSSLGSLQQQNTTPTAPNNLMNRPLGPLNMNYGQLLGSGQSAAPNFTGYNPYTTVAGPNPGYRFFPTS